MAKIPRKFHKIFAAGVSAVGNIAKFGSAAAGTFEYTNDPELIQSLGYYDQGWKPATLLNRSPEIQDRNALDFQNSYQIAYLHQEGISEWNSQTEYATGGYAKVAGVTYVSKQNLNTNNAVTDTNWWQTLGSFIYADVMKMHYPVGETYYTRRSGNPSTWLGFGTWEAYGAGRIAVALDATQAEFAAIDQTGGSKTHTISRGELPHVQITVAANGATTENGEHTHPTAEIASEGPYAESGDVSGGTGLIGKPVGPAGAHVHDVSVAGQTDFLGNGTALSILPPYIVAGYGWIRTA